MDNGASSYRRFLDGDKFALVEIIRDYKDGLIFFINGFVKDLGVAEELAQDTFVRLYVKKPKYSEKSGFKTWLYGIGRNVALDYIRKKAKSGFASIDEVEISDDMPDPESEYFNEQKKVLLHKALCRLKAEYHQILWLFYFEDMSAKEAARIMKKTENNINVLLHRARNALKEELLKEGLNNENL